MKLYYSCTYFKIFFEKLMKYRNNSIILCKSTIFTLCRHFGIFLFEYYRPKFNLGMQRDQVYHKCIYRFQVSIIKFCKFLTRFGKWTVLFCIRFGKWTNYQTLLYFVHNLHRFGRFGIVLVGLVFGPTVDMQVVDRQFICSR